MEGIYKHPIFEWNKSLASKLMKKLKEEEMAWGNGNISIKRLDSINREEYKSRFDSNLNLSRIGVSNNNLS